MVGLLVASAATIPQAMDEAQRRQQYFLELDVSVSKPTVMHIFADEGFGFRPQNVMPLVLQPSPEPVSRYVPLQLGTYWGVRLDPADAGTVVLRNVRITDRDGRTIRRLRPDRFRPSEFVTIAERTEEGLTATVTPGHGVPQLTYVFDVPVVLVLTRADALRWAGVGYLVALVCTLATYLVVRARSVRGSSGGSTSWWERRRAAAIAGVAAVSTLLSIHPLLLGHSLATPNNGPSTFVDDRPPYWLDSDAGPFRVGGTNRVLNGGVPAFLSLETITGFEALVSPQTRWLGTQFTPLFPYALPSEGGNSAQSVSPLLDFWGVRYRVAAANTPSGRPLDRTERSTAWPRAFFAGRVEVYDGRRAFVDRLREATTPFAAVHARDSAAEGATRALRGLASTFDAAYNYRLTPNSTSFMIDAPSAGVVVLGETYWPGVTATLDGRRAPVIRINEAMRAVVVDRAGTWQVAFRYRPGHWTTALWMAAAGVGMMALLLRAGVRKPR
jgi:hypothetical protein